MNKTGSLDQTTKKILDLFENISAIPRSSEKEEKIRNYLISWAKENGFEQLVDKPGNLIIKVPATKGKENLEPIVLQGHLDMVCEKTPDSNHNFDEDPIKFIYKGDWLHADKTTLGADNGIAIAIMMYLATAQDVSHPPLELLLTVEEETGLTGATQLEPNLLTGKKLINIDSEDEGHITIGCAGGQESDIELNLLSEPLPNDFISMKIQIVGLTGGHSGVNIHQERGNAIALLARVLLQIKDSHDLRLLDINGGTAHNAIPRSADAVIIVPSTSEQDVFKIISQTNDTIKSELKVSDPELSLTAEIMPLQQNRQVFMSHDSQRLLSLLFAIPHGVKNRSKTMPNMVETSSNLAKVFIDQNTAKINTSQRSSVSSCLADHTKQIETIARLSGARVISNNPYPAWQPDVDSKLLKNCIEIYKNTFGNEPTVETIHAGLECGIIGSKYPGMEMLSIGPTIQNPHSPEERMNIPSLKKLCHFLVKIVEEV